MQEVSKYTVFNIREYLNGNNEELGEDDLRQVLSEFSCEKNPDVERFAKEQSIEFAKKQQPSPIWCFQQKMRNLWDILQLPKANNGKCRVI